MRKTGIYQILGSNSYFIPNALPPENPALALDNELLQQYEIALVSLAKFNEMSRKLSNKERFIKAYVFKEALLSSAIENIHTTMLDIFAESSGAVPINKDTTLVVSYIKALEVALHMIVQDNMPLVNKVLLAAHEALMKHGHGGPASPGEFRKQSVKVGNLVPPPPLEIPDLMSDLEKYINNDELQGLKLLKAGLAHVQFETIHPFLDGNGRIGRLLIVLMLIQDELLQEPIIYPSYYFKKHHHEYYLRLDRVRTHGDFEGWIKFYLQAIHASAQDAYVRIEKIEALELSLQKLIDTDATFAKIRDTSKEALHILFSNPVIDATRLSEAMDKSYNTAQKILKQFVQIGIISEMTEQKRNKLYQFKQYLAILDEEFQE